MAETREIFTPYEERLHAVIADIICMLEHAQRIGVPIPNLLAEKIAFLLDSEDTHTRTSTTESTMQPIPVRSQTSEHA